MIPFTVVDTSTKWLLGGGYAGTRFEENLEGAPKHQPERARSGRFGGRARADSLTPAEAFRRARPP